MHTDVCDLSSLIKKHCITIIIPQMLLEGEASPPPGARILAGWQRPGCSCGGLGTKLAKQPLSLLENSLVLQHGLW